MYGVGPRTDVYRSDPGHRGGDQLVPRREQAIHCPVMPVDCHDQRCRRWRRRRPASPISVRVSAAWTRQVATMIGSAASSRDHLPDTNGAAGATRPRMSCAFPRNGGLHGTRDLLRDSGRDLRLNSHRFTHLGNVRGSGHCKYSALPLSTPPARRRSQTSLQAMLTQLVLQPGRCGRSNFDSGI